MTVSICISIKNRSLIQHEGSILKLFPNCVKSISETSNTELVVADFHSNDWKLSDWLPQQIKDVPYKHILVDGDFSRGKGLNIAAENATYKKLFFLDADCTINQEEIDYIISILEKGKIYFPEVKYCDINNNCTHTPISTMGYGVCAMNKPVFEKIGKWPEFYSWGGEDDILYSKTDKSTVIKKRTNNILHQWHPDKCKYENYIRPARADSRNYKG